MQVGSGWPVSLCVLLAIALQTTPTAQTRVWPYRVMPLFGFSDLSGRVIAADTGAPVEGAEVRLALAKDVRAYQGPPRITHTDAEGRFRFDFLEHGVLSLSARKSGYLRAYYRPTSPSVEPELDPGQSIEVVLELERAGVITGVVRTDSGNPVAGIAVRRQSLGLMPLGVAFHNAVTTRTDVTGVYVFDDLPPAEYIVSVPITTVSGPAGPLSDSDLTRSRRARSFAPSPSAGDGSVAAVEIRQADRALPEHVLRSESLTTRTWTTTYGPSTTELDAARIVQVDAGAAPVRADIVLMHHDTTTITGRLIDDDGPVSGVGVRLLAGGSTLRFVDQDVEVAATTTDDDGRFRLHAAVGDYTLQAFLGSAPLDVDGPMDQLTGWTLQEVDATSGQVELGALRMRPPLSISGQALASGAGANSGRSVAGLPLDAIVEHRYSTALAPWLSSRIDVTGRFTIPGLMPGRVLLAVNRRAPTMPLRSNRVNGTTADIVTLSDQSITAMRLVLSGRPSRVGGTVVNAAGRAVAYANVAIFPADYESWLTDGSTLTSTWSLADAFGRFSLDQIAPGDYLIVAVPDGALATWPSRHAVTAVAPFATPVTVEEGRSKTLQVRVTPR